MNNSIGINFEDMRHPDLSSHIENHLFGDGSSTLRTVDPNAPPPAREFNEGGHVGALTNAQRHEPAHPDQGWASVDHSTRDVVRNRVKANAHGADAAIQVAQRTLGDAFDPMLESLGMTTDTLAQNTPVGTVTVTPTDKLIGGAAAGVRKIRNTIGF